jgi:hypothetical protein
MFMKLKMDSIDKFFDLILSAPKLFNPKHYPIDNLERIQKLDLWLERLINIFVMNEDDHHLCRTIVLEFVETKLLNTNVFISNSTRHGLM